LERQLSESDFYCLFIGQPFDYAPVIRPAQIDSELCEKYAQSCLKIT